ncbi:MAG: hypothetical protein KIT84_25465 [Labilithrix sp.]|nr:hypothetical protein [Labilithrix sp.]MCW5814401.1 hypothetical protein [Labilithrix sp.]
MPLGFVFVAPGIAIRRLGSAAETSAPLAEDDETTTMNSDDDARAPLSDREGRARTRV